MEEDTEYKFSAKMDIRLSKIIGEEDMAEIVNKIECKAPDSYGLNNSERIIPSYYHFEKKSISEISNFNYLDIIKDDIRNLRPLNDMQLEYVNKLDSNDKNVIIKLFNECIYIVKDYLS